jgi:hypothetical protein
MAKNAQDSNESLNANSSDAASEANPYINDDAATGSRFGWIKTKPAKIAAISVGGALALGAVFAGGAVAGQVASHNEGPSIGAPFDGGKSGDSHFGGQGKFGPEGNHGIAGSDDEQFDGPDGDGFAGPDGDQFGKHAPRPPHDFDGDGPNSPEFDDEGDDAPAPSGLQSN